MCQVYIIDDDPVYVKIVETLIRKHNLYESYRSYTNPVNALIDLFDSYYSSKTLPSVILLDLFMPKLSGWNFLDSFNSIASVEGSNTAVYVITSSIDPVDKQRALLYSCVKGVLSKPASFEMLKGLQLC